MKNLVALLLLAVLLPLRLEAQQRQLDSLVQVEQRYLQEDSVRAKLLTDLARRYYSIDPNIGAKYAQKAIALCEKLPDKKFLANAYSAMGANKLVKADYVAALEQYQKALQINERLGNQQGIGNNYNNIGLVYSSIFDYPRALEYYQKTLRSYEKTGNQTSLGNTLSNIGNIYYELREYEKAIEYYEKALLIGEQSGNQQSVAGNLVNIGNGYTRLEDYKKALEYKQKALAINEKIGNPARIANNLGNIGNVYTKMADYPAALRHHERALAISEQIKDPKAIASNYTSIGDVYYHQKNFGQALVYTQKALELANSIGLLNTASEALLNLSQIYQATEKYDSAYLAYKGHIKMLDSINTVEKRKEVTKKSLQYEFSKKEDSLKQQQIIVRLAFLKSQADLQYEQSVSREKAEQLQLAENEKTLQATQMSLQKTRIELQDKELQAQRTQGLYYLGGIVLLSLLSFFIFRNFLNQRRSNRIIQVEKQKSDTLLLNILPAEVANELKESGHAMARQFEAVTVLFTDFVDFTRVSERLSPHELVGELHLNFKAFDEIMERYGMEKIKTIGDAYMAVSGLPVPNPEHAQLAARAALEIQAFVRRRQAQGHKAFDIRIGLHSGPVVAGIVGVKKFAYDIWGDTVNTASRMESSSEPGKINLSGATHALLKDSFKCVHRGKVTAKNKGEVDMYFLEAG